MESFSERQFNEITSIDREDWKKELQSHDEFFASLGEKMPSGLKAQRKRLVAALE